LKDNREIIHGIRVMLDKSEGKKLAQSHTYSSGMEDELAAAFTQKELDAMKERGDITGNWKSTKGKAAASTTTAPAK
jgi:hypothetical protein